MNVFDKNNDTPFCVLQWLNNTNNTVKTIEPFYIDNSNANLLTQLSVDIPKRLIYFSNIHFFISSNNHTQNSRFGIYTINDNSINYLDFRLSITDFNSSDVSYRKANLYIKKLLCRHIKEIYYKLLTGYMNGYFIHLNNNFINPY